jgi:hypothetical protein
MASNGEKRRIRRLIMRMLTVAIMVTTIFSCGTIGMASMSMPAANERAAAEARWRERTFTRYMITVRVEIRGSICLQQLEVSGAWVRRVLENTCEALWLDYMTVDQLFAMRDEVAAIPGSRCFPNGRECPCERIFTRRDYYYDPQSGFPEMIVARSEIRANWASADYWRTGWNLLAAPACDANPRRLTFQVLSLTPIE